MLNIACRDEVLVVKQTRNIKHELFKANSKIEQTEAKRKALEDALFEVNSKIEAESKLKEQTEAEQKDNLKKAIILKYRPWIEILHRDNPKPNQDFLDNPAPMYTQKIYSIDTSYSINDMLEALAYIKYRLMYPEDLDFLPYENKLYKKYLFLVDNYDPQYNKSYPLFTKCERQWINSSSFKEEITAEDRQEAEEAGCWEYYQKRIAYRQEEKPDQYYYYMIRATTYMKYLHKRIAKKHEMTNVYDVMNNIHLFDNNAN